jgi:hypothetical protein
MSRTKHLNHVSTRLANVNPNPTPVPMCEGADATPRFGGMRRFNAALDRWFDRRGMPRSEISFLRRPQGVKL